jgi:DnaJ-class molecular chaperone
MQVKKCKRCAGSGFVIALGCPVECSRCDGDGAEPSEDKAKRDWYRKMRDISADIGVGL